MEDEGYTSPSEEVTLLYTPHTHTQGSQQHRTGGGDANSSFSDCEVEHEIPWEDFASEPNVCNNHISWDDVPCPFPYRKRDMQSANKRNRKLLSRSFFSDNSKASCNIVDNVWRISKNKSAVKANEAEGNAGDGTGDAGPISVPDFIDNVKSKAQDPVYMTYADFIHHLLHLLCGRESQSFTFGKERRFQKSPYTLIHGMTPSSLNNYSQSFIQCGTIFRKLWMVAYELKQDDIGFGVSCVREGRSGKVQQGTSSAVFIAFQRLIGDYLKLYQTILMLKGTSINTLTKLAAFITPLRFQMQILEQIVDTKLSGNSVVLLAELNELLFTHETPFIGDLLRSIFVTCSSAYLKYISDWIFRGDLGPSSEFHIRMEGSAVYQDRRFWTKQYAQSDHVPLFLVDSLGLIFETGKSICLFNLIKDVHLSGHASSSSLFSYDTDKILKAQLSFEGLHSLTQEWETKLSCFFEENSHLELAIRLTIDEVISNSGTRLAEPDLHAVQKARCDYANKVEMRRQESLNYDKERKRNLYLTLGRQIEESKERKVLEKDTERVEHEKNVEFNQRKDREKCDQEKRFTLKYFGSPNKPSPAVAIATIPTQSYVAKPEESHYIVPVAQSYPDPSVSIDSPRISRSNDSSQLAACLNEDSIVYFIKPGLELVARASKRSYVRKKRKEKTVSELMTHKYAEAECPSGVILAEGEERFNPDNIIVRKPPPYNVKIDFEKSLMIWDGKDRSTPEPELNLITDPYCINHFLSQSVLVPVVAQHRMVNCALLHYFITEKKLYHHLAALNDFLLLQNGLFGHFLNELLIQEVKRRSMKSSYDLAQRSGQLNLILGEALSIALEGQETNPLLKNLSFTMVREKDIVIKELLDNEHLIPNARSEYNVLNSLRLKYIVEWPLNIIIPEDMLNYYENLFAILIQLLRTESLLAKVFMHLKCKRSNSFQLVRLHQYRHKMLVFVRTVRSYMNVTVIHTAWTDLCSSLHQLNNIESIYEHLVNHIKNISANCLIGPKLGPMLKTLVRELIVIESFCAHVETICAKAPVNWDAGEELPRQDFKELCQKFTVAQSFEDLFLKSNVMKFSVP